MNDIYKDIAVRTGGDILIGVVGPVRSGKSTFVTKFMEQLVIPNIQGKNKKQIAVDELPQSAQGKTIMTTEPKFVPAEAVTVKLDKTQAKIRLIDCVGYMVDGAIGHEEDGAPRLVKTPWQDAEMPFEKAGEYGTQKVIKEHSTIGVIVTSDGTFTDVDRKAYKKAEERVVNELKSLYKPFIVLFNTVDPTQKGVIAECAELEKEYGAAVVPVNVTTLGKDDISNIFEKVLLEFPVRVINFDLPKWVRALPDDNKIVSYALDRVKAVSGSVVKMSDCKFAENAFDGGDVFTEATAVDLDMASGAVSLRFDAKAGLFYKVVSEECGEPLDGEFALLSYVRSLKEAKNNYENIKSALERAMATGYGIVPASMDGAEIGEARTVKRNGQYCVKMDVSAKSLHLIKADVHAEVDIVSGTKEQCDGFVAGLSDQSGAGLETEVFGRRVSDILGESLVGKSCSVNENVKSRLKRTVNKAVNEKKTGLICILI